MSEATEKVTNIFGTNKCRGRKWDQRSSKTSIIPAKNANTTPAMARPIDQPTE